MGCENNDCGAGSVVTVYKGDDVLQRVMIQKNGQPVDLTNATEIKTKLQNDPTETPATLELTLVNSGIVRASGTAGALDIAITAVQSAKLKESKQVDIDIVVVDGGKTQTYRVKNALTIAARDIP